MRDLGSHIIALTVEPKNAFPQTFSPFFLFGLSPFGHPPHGAHLGPKEKRKSFGVQRRSSVSKKLPVCLGGESKLLVFLL